MDANFDWPGKKPGDVCGNRPGTFKVTFTLASVPPSGGDASLDPSQFVNDFTTATLGSAPGQYIVQATCFLSDPDFGQFACSNVAQFTLTATIGKQLTVLPVKPILPTSSRVDSNGHVLTESALSLNVSQNGQPVSGVTITLESDRGGHDDITNPPSPTDLSGNARGAKGDTRNQQGTSTIRSAFQWVATVRFPSLAIRFSAAKKSVGCIAG